MTAVPLFMFAVILCAGLALLAWVWGVMGDED